MASLWKCEVIIVYARAWQNHRLAIQRTNGRRPLVALAGSSGQVSTLGFELRRLCIGHSIQVHSAMESA